MVVVWQVVGPTSCERGSCANGHGTHVAGIVARKLENFKGVAPDATWGMWRGFGCQGLTSNDVLVQAMLDAYEAGVDVISLSLGFGSGNNEDTLTSVVPFIISHWFLYIKVQVSVFSSIDPRSEIDFKPDIAGFGGNGYSTLPSYLGGWGMTSGTSMATHLSTKPKFITEQFQNYAYKAPNSHATGIDSPLAQGAGIIQVYDTIMQDVHITPGALSFNDTANIVRTQQWKIRNSGDSTISYQITNNAGVAIQPYDGKNGYDHATIKVTLTPPKTNPYDHIVYGAYIQFKSQVPNNEDLTVPYFGIVGEQHKLPIFMPGSPVVSDASGSRWYKNKDDVFVFDTRSGNIPYFVYGFQTPTAHVKVMLYTEDGRQELGNVQPGMDHLGHTRHTS
ncbi:hypothetical protein O0I10_000642 [Lichtheimia ornata]|uniref:Peptidase S8/S53 domain-containing protein n=1 Tax=Lichtheimia ornata TaxID=688661 RepID=A0AAD7Y417_9FUNG|nr:uncharacterized protein O0I10_000642 [Lichtheimia ornata]KAJ8663403.1 hypothetical protein O0I10_000642 [Lichtheimia ornata]